jgi:hypothetical protein
MREMRFRGLGRWRGYCLLPTACCLLLAGCIRAKPEGDEGQLAQELAARLEAAVDIPAWKKVGAVRWIFRGKNRHLWDRTRGLALFSSGEGKDEVKAMIHVGSKRGIAFRGGERVSGDDEKKLLEQAYSSWANDSYWLNPIAKLRDKGVTLAASEDAPDRLVVHFSSGGVTPGDTYAYQLGQDGKPVAWYMWVKILPVKGAKSSFAGWKQLPGGAWISTEHKVALGAKLSVDLTEVESADTAAALNGGQDPFAPLLEAEGKPAGAPASAPTSAPAPVGDPESDSQPAE